jgi:hypothetical protein
MDDSKPQTADQCSSPRAASSRGWRIARQFCGWGLLALGVAGLILPILPGWFFIAWGILILAPDVPFLGRLLDGLAKRVPALRSAIDRARGGR